MSETTTGRLRGFLMSDEAEAEVQIKDGRIIFGEDQSFGNMRMASVLSQAVASGGEALILYDNQDYFFECSSAPNEEVEIQNGSLMCAFDGDLVEIFPEEVATQADIDVLLVAIDSYPCRIDINGLSITVYKNCIDCVEPEEEGE